MEKQTGNDPECARMMVFIASHFPNATKIKLTDENHFLTNRNVILEKETKRFFEVKCFERRGIHFVGQRVLNNGNLYTITEINPFYMFLPYLWSDLQKAETNKTNMTMKPLTDIINDDRSNHTIRMLPIPEEIKLALHENDILVQTLKKVTINKEFDGLFYKASKSMLFDFLKAKMETLIVFIKKNGFLVENSLRKIEFMQNDLESYALEIIQEVLPQAIFLEFLAHINKRIEDVFKNDDPKPVDRENNTDYSDGISKPTQKIKVNAPASTSGNSKIQKASAAAGQTSMNSYFAKK